MYLVLGLTAKLLCGQGSELTYEHRVVVATTSLDREIDVESSLAQNVNQLASRGFEVGAMVGGSGRLLDSLLDRKAYQAGLVDHGGHVFVVMHRPVGPARKAREYRFLHSRGPLGVQEIVASYGRDGFQLKATAWEGEYFHAAFERDANTLPTEYRVFRNAGRRGWDEQILNDNEVKLRLQRVIPMTLDSALVELGPPAKSSAEFVWESDAPHQRSRLETRLNSRAAAGFRVQIARLRGNVLDVALLKPAGTSGPGPNLDLDDGPWGGSCSRGLIAGADIWTDGDIYCVAEDPKGPIANRGIDLPVAPDANLGGQLFFGQYSCAIGARLRSSRPAALRVARAMQMERELNRRVERGYRVTRAFAGSKDGVDQRLVFFTSRLPAQPSPGPSVSRSESPQLEAAPDLLGQQLLAEREAELNESLSAELQGIKVEAWAEINDIRANRHVLLLGCASTRLDRERAEMLLRNRLARTPYATFRIRNEIIVDLLR